MLLHAYATGGGFPDVIRLLLDTHMDLAWTSYGDAAYRPTSRHNLAGRTAQ